MLSPSGVALACVGMQLEITCNTTSNLQWILEIMLKLYQKLSLSTTLLGLQQYHC